MAVRKAGDVRKRIPDRVKLIACLRRFGLTIDQVEFDHSPALGLRPINPVTGDCVPPANDPDGIVMLLVSEHREKTFGKGGEKRATTYGSDIHAIAKTRRLEKQQEEARRRMLAKEPGQPPPRKSKWPSRPFQTTKKKRKETANED